MKLSLKNRAAYFEAGHFEGGKSGESGIYNSNTTFAAFPFLDTAHEEIRGLIKSFLCERSLLAAVQSYTQCFI